jgi:YfiR/HmsC-like
LNVENLSRSTARQMRQKTVVWPEGAGSRFCAGLLVAIFMSLSGAPPSRSQDATPVEYQVKSAFLLNFAKFIEWPAEVFQDEKTPISICIFRYDPFSRSLDNILQGKTINNRQVVARRIVEPAELSACQIVFVSEREERSLPDVLNRLKGLSVLVIGETGAFAERGGGIQFFLEDHRLRFAVNVDAVRKARLNVSSKLLALAKIVHDQSYPKTT